MHPFYALAVPSGAVGIHWFGQSSFAFKDAGGTVVQVDPYFPSERPAERFIHAQPPLDETTLPTNLVLLTHNHRDHTWPESLLKIHHAFGDCRFVGPVESIENLRGHGIPEASLILVNAGDTLELDDVTIHVVWAKPPHGAPEDGIQPPDVQHFGFVVEMGGVRIYVSGDPIHTFADHDELTQPIADLRPDIGLLTTHPDEGEFPFFAGSAKMAQKIGVKTAVPAHYQCFVKRNYDPQAWVAAFPQDEPKLILIPYNRAVVYRPS